MPPAVLGSEVEGARRQKLVGLQRRVTCFPPLSLAERIGISSCNSSGSLHGSAVSSF